MNLTENDILAKLRDGSPRERSAVIQYLYNSDWKNYAVKAIKSVGGRNLDIDDLFQECLAALVTQVMVGKFKGKSKLSTYFYEICRRRCMKLNSKNQVTQNFAKNIVDAHAELDSDYMHMEEVRKEKLRILVDKVIMALDEPCSSILKYLKLGYSHAEIASILGYENPDTVKNQASRCRKKMRNFILSETKLYREIKALR